MNKERPFLHFDKEESYLYHIGLALLPLIIYGFYKNGLLPFLNQDISLFQMFRPLCFPLIGFGIGAITDYLIWWRNDQETIWTNYPIYGLLISMTMPIQTNLCLFAIFLFLLFAILRKFSNQLERFSPLLVTQVILSILFVFLAHVPFLNKSEMNNPFVYSMVDIFFGRSIGGVSTTSIFWLLIAYAYLWFDPYYKKEIPISILLSYTLWVIVFEIILPTGDMLKMILNSSVVFASIFVASEMVYSPYTEKGRIIYSIIIGTIGFFLTRFFHNIEGIYISIFLISIFVPVIDEIVNKYQQKEREVLSNGQKKK